MSVTYLAQVIYEGKHASLVIPQKVLEELGTNKRAPLKVTVNGHTYQSTATGVAGECRVVFPIADRIAAKVESQTRIEITLELDSGYREVELPEALEQALTKTGKLERFKTQNFTTRKAQVKSITEAKSEATKTSRIEKILARLHLNQ